MLQWFRTKGLRTIGLLILGYAAHLFIETFIITNVLALMGWSMPVLI